jgi:iron complex transport system ATP-binding protein
MTLSTDDLSAGYGSRVLIPDLTLELEHGAITAIIGPNGCGKSTLLKTLAGLLEPVGGSVLLHGRDIVRLSTREIARELAVLPQAPVVPSRLSVKTLVEQGRYPHVGPLGMLRERDDEAVSRALEATGITELAARDVDELSGGERQRAWIALALAQETPALLLDEPTTYLDIGYQLEVLELIRELNRERGLSVAMVLHDLNHAARFSDRIIAMKDGRIVADGTPRAVVDSELVLNVFEVEGRVMHDDGVPIFVPRRSVRRDVVVPA